MRRVVEREALVFGGELVGVVDAVVAGVAQGGFVGSAEYRSLVFVTHVALDLHYLYLPLISDSPLSFPDRYQRKQ